MTDDTQNQFVHVSPFESIRQTNEHGSAYWSARDLSKILDYTNWRNFRSAIEKAITACINSGQDPDDHFATATKISRRAKSATSEIEDFHLSRYACYLVVQNADPSKEIVASARPTSRSAHAGMSLPSSARKTRGAWTSATK